MPSGSWSDEPIPPSIDVQSPSERLNYDVESDIWLNFSVTVPLTSWYSTSMKPYPDNYATTFGHVTQVSFSLDGRPAINLDEIYEYLGVLSFSVEIGCLSIGKHNIIINAEGLASYGNLTHDIFVGSQYSFKNSTKAKLVETSKIISFVIADTKLVDISLEEPNEVDSSSEGTEEGKLATSANDPFPTSSIMASFVTVAVLVGLCLLLYGIKRK
jgi:hypothetical protein